VVATVTASMAGYALARFEFRGKALVSAIVMGVLVVPGAVLLAPSYQLLYGLNLLDSFAGLILPAAAPAFGVFLFRQAVKSSVPPQLLEAARIDGAGELRIYFEIALPLLRPMVGAFLLITFLGTWNNFIGPQIVLQTPERFPLAVAVSQLRGVYYQDYGLQMAGTLVSVFPVLALFLLLQNEFIAGLTTGAVKG
jgi:ABC-type glycerol-3-phosphate transport system permease component